MEQQCGIIEDEGYSTVSSWSIVHVHSDMEEQCGIIEDEGYSTVHESIVKLPVTSPAFK